MTKVNQEAVQQEVVQTQQKQEEEVTMTNQQVNQEVTMGRQPEYVTKEDLQNVVAALMDSTTTLFEGVQTRVDASAKMMNEITKHLNSLSNNQPAQATASQPEAAPQQKETPQSGVKEQPAAETKEVNLDEIVYSDDQISALNRAKDHSKDAYDKLKNSFDSINTILGRTVGGVLNQTADFLDDKGHKGVDAVSDLIDETINSAHKIVLSLVDLSATTLHSANNITRSAGHVIINGVVYTLDGAGNMVQRKN